LKLESTQPRLGIVLDKNVRERRREYRSILIPVEISGWVIPFIFAGFFWPFKE